MLGWQSGVGHAKVLVSPIIPSPKLSEGLGTLDARAAAPRTRIGSALFASGVLDTLDAFEAAVARRIDQRRARMQWSGLDH